MYKFTTEFISRPYLGYLTIIASILSLCVKIYTQKKIINSLSEKWQKHIKGDWYSFGITYIGKKKEVTGYHWTFKYNFWKGKFEGRGQSLRDDMVSYKVIKLNLKGDYIFLLGECNNHSGEIIFGILHEIYPIATTEKMTGVFTGLSYESRLPHTTEFYFSKNKPNLTELNNDLYKLKIQTKQFLWNDVFKTKDLSS